MGTRREQTQEPPSTFFCTKTNACPQHDEEKPPDIQHAAVIDIQRHTAQKKIREIKFYFPSRQNIHNRHLAFFSILAYFSVYNVHLTDKFMFK